MKPDEFEQQLQRQPLRAVPAEWRAEILASARAAHAASSRRAAQKAQRPSEPVQEVSALRSWREWFWPCPQAWGALAAVWIILLGLRVTAPATSADMARQSNPERRRELAAQRRELARLLDLPLESTPAVQAPVPGPRSERISPSKA